MPTVLREHGLRFVIFVNDHPPPLVHVTGRGAARIGIRPPHDVSTIQGMAKADVVRARNAVRRERDLFLDVWTRVHGGTD